MKPMWKVTCYAQCMLLFSVVPPTVDVRIYRWKWRAKLSCWLNNVPAIGVPVVCWATLEPYWPNSNVVPLRRAA